MNFNPHHRGFMSEINVTPFVDVMLVLLVMFMVTAPMLNQGVEIDLPQTKTVETLPEDSDVMLLTIHKDGKIFLDEYPIEEENLESQLKKFVSDQKKVLYLSADRMVEYGTVVKVMARIKAAGIERLGVMAEPEETQP
ncbi:MAG: protein TolR [Desulfovibrionales bacterium]